MTNVVQFPAVHNDPDPKSLRSFIIRWNENSYTRGVGLLTTVHLACPFCASPEWLIHGTRDAAKKLTAGAVCRFCLRGAKFMSTKTPTGNRAVLYQTVGSPPPIWMPDKPLRLEDHDHAQPSAPDQEIRPVEEQDNAGPAPADQGAPDVRGGGPETDSDPSHG
jgi:hypothetical protein